MAITTLNLRGINRSDTATSGQVITATSAVAADFQDAPGGRHTLLATTTVTSATASVAFTSNIDSTYRTYLVTINNLIPVTDGTVLKLQIYVGGAYKTDSYYRYGSSHTSSDNTHTANYNAADSYFRLNGDEIGDGTGENLCGQIEFYTPSDTTEFKIFRWQTVMIRNNGQHSQNNGSGFYNNGQAAVTGLKLFMDSGNIETGQFKLFGVT